MNEKFNHRMLAHFAVAPQPDPERSVRKNDLMRKVTRKQLEGLFLIRGVGGIGVMWQAAPFFLVIFR